MFVTNHVLSGALLGAASPGPVSAFTAGVASHFALDAIPHWGGVDFEEVLPVAVCDGLIGLATMAVVTAAARPGRRLRMMAGMTGAAFPDLDKPFRLVFGRSPWPEPVNRFHVGIQRESPRRMPHEVVAGATLAALALKAARAER
jgi:hypothetical protein